MMRLFHRHDPDQPCQFMVSLLHKKAEGRIRGLAALYAAAHVLRCGPCRRFLESLEAMLLRLKESRAADPSDDVYARLMEGEWTQESGG